LPMPENLSFAQAAGFTSAYSTAYHSLVQGARLQPGETVLVHGAAGGIGLAAVQLAKLMGATVIATASRDDKLEVVGENGADHLINYSEGGFREKVKALTGGRGADVVYDPVGGDVFDASLRCIVPDGRILVIGFAGGRVQQIPANVLLVKNVTVIGYYWGAYRRLDPASIRASLSDLLEWFAQGKLHPHVSQVLPLERASEALQMLKNRTATGKIVLQTGG